METNPIHTYAITNTYTVRLIVAGPGGSDTITKTSLIKVHAFPPIHPAGWDLNFGDYGRINYYECDQGYGTTMEMQQDEKILVVFRCGIHEEMRRYQQDGSIDPSFDNDGSVQLLNNDASSVVTISSQEDGKIVIATTDMTLIRLNANGSYDIGFGVNGIADVFPNANPSKSSFKKLKIQADGKIIVSGIKDDQPIIVRYTTAGELDLSFNERGYTLAPLAEWDTDRYDASWSLLDIFTNGKILAGRHVKTITDPFTGEIQDQFILMRYHGNGTPDQEFGTNGILETEFFSDLIIQPDNRIIAAAPRNLVRLHYNGTVDQTFVDSSDRERGQLLLDAWNRIYGHLTQSNDESILRYLADGSIDTTFGRNGELNFPRTNSNIEILSEANGDLLILESGFIDYYRPSIRRYIDNHPQPPPAAPKPLMLLYAVLDNNLGDGWSRLVNNIESGMRSGMTVRLLIDGPTDNDVYLYDVMQDNNPFCPSPTNPTCDGRYAEGANFWRLTNENSAHPGSLYQFLVDAMNAYPTADKINLALIGHGSGWSANVLPGQPSIWRDQNDTVGGMLWDDHPALGQQDSRSLSTKALGQALTWAGEQTGKPIDLLYLDGCSMGMAEVAYEVRNGARYLLASPNIDWASFNYQTLLPEIANATGRALGERWLQLEAAEFRANPGHPFTLALLDLSQIGRVASAASALADSLRALLPAQQAQLLAAFTTTDRFDSDYDGDLDTLDAYSDLPAFVGQVSQTLPNVTAVQQASQTLQTALTAAVVAKDSANGSPWLFGEQLWQWRNYGGLGIYLPLGKDEVRRRLFYHANNLAWTADTTWDEFLTAFWGGNSHAAITESEMPVCHATTQGCQGLANPLPVQTPTARFVYLPVVRK
jgi:uncharacterized delta-60 repeat protein